MQTPLVELAPRRLFVWMLAFYSALLFMQPAFAAEDGGKSMASEAVKKRTAFAYKPPNRGAPSSRMGGGTRSISQLQVMAPQHTGISSRSEPRLFWFVSSGFRNEIHVSISEQGAAGTLLDIKLPPNAGGGIMSLDLAGHGLSLQAGSKYTWSVLLKPLPHERWPALKSASSIEVRAPDAELQASAVEQRPYLAAEKGYWYDALDSRLVEQQPDNQALRLQRVELLRQGGLDGVADYDAEMAGG